MTNREVGRSGSVAASSSSFIHGLEPLPTSTAMLDASALAFEHILASIARVEARLDAGDRQPISAPPQSRPDPDPSYADQMDGRREPSSQGLIMTATISMATQPPLGFAGPSTMRGPSAWAPVSYGGVERRDTQLAVWNNPAHRQEWRGGERRTAWEIPSGGRGSDHYFEPPRYDQQCYEQPRYEKMKPP